MNNRWKQTASILTIFLSFLGLISLALIAKEIQNTVKLIGQGQLKTYEQPKVLLAKSLSACQNINSEYQEVHSFETQNYYINICQLANNFFYYRQSKYDTSSTLLIPAQTVFGGKIFQAVDGKVTYFVGIDDNGYYSSVMQNNNEIVFEPELQLPSALLPRGDESVHTSPVSDLNMNNLDFNNADLELDTNAKNSNKSLICTQAQKTKTSCR